MKHKFALEKRKIIVTATLYTANAIKDFNFIIDTGATTSVIDTNVAMRLGFDLAKLKQIRLTTVGGNTSSRNLKLPRINLFDTEIINFNMNVIDLPYQITLFADGLIGMDFLLNFRELKFNFEEKIIEI
jgi:clan AA aspartic protease (TIGR02281 family)